MCRAAWPAFPDKKGGLQSRPPLDSLTGKRQCPSGDGDRQADDRAAGRRDAGRGGDHHGAGRDRHGCRGAGRDGHRGDDSPGAGRRGEDRDGGNPDEDRGGHRDGDSRDGGQDGRRGDGTRGEVREGAPFCSVPWDGACPCTSLHGGRCRCGPPGSRAIRPCDPHDPRPRTCCAACPSSAKANVAIQARARAGSNRRKFFALMAKLLASRGLPVAGRFAPHFPHSIPAGTEQG